MAEQPFLRILGDVEAQRVAVKLASAPERLRLTGAAAMSALARRVREQVKAGMQEEAPRRTGELAASMDVVLTRGPDGWLLSAVSTVPYAAYVVEGTGIYHAPDAHEAWDVYGPQHFQVDGQDVYAMHTHHEGQQPDDFPGRALEKAQPLIVADLHGAAYAICASFWPRA